MKKFEPIFSLTLSSPRLRRGSHGRRVAPARRAFKHIGSKILIQRPRRNFYIKNDAPVEPARMTPC